MVKVFYRTQVNNSLLNAAYKFFTPGGDRLSQLNARAWGGEAISAGELVGTGLLAGAEIGLIAFPQLAGFKVNIFSKGNVAKVISEKFQIGIRIDPAHHGKAFGHMEIWGWGKKPFCIPKKGVKK